MSPVPEKEQSGVAGNCGAAQTGTTPHIKTPAMQDSRIANNPVHADLDTNNRLWDRLLG